jgi:manganese efflux pump family protein
MIDLAPADRPAARFDPMSWLTILGLAVGLAMDALAVAIATGLVLGSPTRGQTMRLAFHFGLFQFLMPVAGWLAGRTVEAYIREVDHWLAFGLLAFVGGKMLWEARRDEADVRPGDPTRGWMLLVLSVATSVDALAVGLSMAFLQVSIWLPSLVIGLVAFAFTVAGILLGSRVGRALGRWPEVVGGLVLLGIGAKILAEHLGV